MVPPGEQASLSYWFRPDENFPPREFQVWASPLAPDLMLLHMQQLFIHSSGLGSASTFASWVEGPLGGSAVGHTMLLPLLHIRTPHALGIYECRDSHGGGAAHRLRMYRGAAWEREISDVTCAGAARASPQVALTVFYHTPAAGPFASTFFNRTIDITEVPPLVDLQGLFLLVAGLALLGALGAPLLAPS